MHLPQYRRTLFVIVGLVAFVIGAVALDDAPVVVQGVWFVSAMNVITAYQRLPLEPSSSAADPD